MFGNPLHWIRSRILKEPTALAPWGREEMGEALEGRLRQERDKLMLRRLWEEQGVTQPKGQRQVNAQCEYLLV